MDDERIIGLYWARSESAIAETERKYGGYCRTIARNILSNREDAEECVSDTWWKAWEAIPPQKPDRLRAFLGRITRNLSLDRIRRAQAQKHLAEVLSELDECLPAPAADTVEQLHLTDCLNRFLSGLPKEKRRIFLLRYWYACPVVEVAKQMEMSKSKATSMLFRLRNDLREFLAKEDIFV